MPNFGIKISKPGIQVTESLTTANKKDFTILSTDSVHKVSAQAVVSADINVAHGLGFAPAYDGYILSNSLTRAYLSKYGGLNNYNQSSDSTYLYVNEVYGTDSLFYIIYLDRP